MGFFGGGGGDATVRITTHLDDRASRSLEALQRKVAKLGTKLMVLGSRIRSTGQSMTIGLTVPIVALGTAITRSFIGFDDKMAQIVALSDASAESVAKWREEILRLAPEVARSPQELADALFFLASAGLEAGTEISVLEIAATASAVGLGTTDTIAKALTNTILAYGQSNVEAAQLAGVLTVAVKKGSLEADELAGELGRLLPLARNLDISFAELTATMATLSLINSDASENASVFVGIMNALIKASPQGNEVLKAVGRSYEGIRQTIKDKGLITALREVNDALAGDPERLAKVFPRIRGLIGLLTLTSLEAKQVDEIFSEISGASAEDLAQAFEDIQTPGFRMRQAMTEIQVLFIRLGDTVVPILVTVFQTLVSVAKGAAEIWESMPSSVQKMVVIFEILLATLGPLLIAFGALIATAGVFVALAPAIGIAVTIATGPFGLLALAILAVIVTIVAVIVWWDEIVVAMGRVVDKVRELLAWFGELPILGTILRTIWDAAQKFLNPVIEQFKVLITIGRNVIQFFKDVFVGDWENAWIDVKNIAASAVDLIINSLEHMGNAAIKAANFLTPFFDPFGELDLSRFRVGQTDRIDRTEGVSPFAPLGFGVLGVGTTAAIAAETIVDVFDTQIPAAVGGSTAAVKELKEEIEELEEVVALTAQEIVSKLGGAASLIADAFEISLETVNDLLVSAAAGAGFLLETLATAFVEIVRTLELTGQQAKELWQSLVDAARDAAEESLTFFEKVMEAVGRIMESETQSLINAVAILVEQGMTILQALLQAMRDLAEADLLAAIEQQLLDLFGNAVSIEDFIGLTLAQIQALLDELAESGGFPDLAQATATFVPETFGNTSTVTINMGGVVIQGNGVTADAVALTDAVEREMRSRRLRGF